MNNIDDGSKQSNDMELFLSAQEEGVSLDQRLFELYLLYKLCKDLNFSHQLDDTFLKSLHYLKESLKIEDFCLMLLDDNEKVLRVCKTDDNSYISTDALKDITFKLGEGVSGEVAQTGKAVVLQDVSKEKGSLYYKKSKEKIGSFMSIPLKLSNGKVVGVLNIHKRRINDIKENDNALFGAIAENIARTIERARLFEEVQRQFIFDDLTSLNTRRYFFESSYKEFNKAKRYGDIFSIIMIDIDYFKSFNDTYGHQLGDNVLKKVAYALKSNVRRGDIIARYGGEEFVILLPKTCKEDTTLIAEKLRIIIEREASIDISEGKKDKITITAGVATYPEDGDTFEKVLAKADEFLYIGKNKGRNRTINSTRDINLFSASDKRLTKRYKVALKVVKAVNLPKYIEIQIRSNEWRMCNIIDISKAGLRGEVEYGIKTGKIYTCQILLNNTEEYFTIKVVHKKRGSNNRYQFGAEITEGQNIWMKVFTLINC